MEEQISPLAATHLLQHTLRSLCIPESSQWVYAVFWRILPRNYPPPKWDVQGGYDRSRGNRRNWILVWEDGFCNFSAFAAEMNTGDCATASSSSAAYATCDYQHYHGLQPELFFKMSHEIYNYGEGLIGKVAADHGHKWIYNEPPNDQEVNFLSAWHNSPDSHPRTWEAQFQSGIKTIALIAVREGVVQLGAKHKVIEDLSYVVMLRKKFAYIESIPGVLLPHPSSSGYPFISGSPSETWHFPMADHQLYHQAFSQQQPVMGMTITPSMSSLETLLSKLPSVLPPSHPGYYAPLHHHYQHTKEEENNGDGDPDCDNGVAGESSNSRFTSYRIQDHFRIGNQRNNFDDDDDINRDDNDNHSNDANVVCGGSRPHGIHGFLNDS